jgi:hypothetical protein
MSIRPPLRSRLIFALGGSAAAALFLFITFMGMFVQHGGPITGFFGVAMSTVFALVAYWGGRSNWLRADERTFTYQPSIGSAKVFARDQLEEIVRVPGAKATTSLQFRTRDGKVLVEPGDSFSRADVERLAAYMSVPLQWDFK